jgi:exopolysaccharide biosynthesis polyprenyl glycosylphosphotransferase
LVLLVIALRHFDMSAGRIFAGHLGWFAWFTVVWLISAVLMDAYSLKRASHLRSAVPVSIGTAALAGLAYLSIPYASPAGGTTGLTALGFLLILIGGSVLWRGVYAVVFSKAPFRKRVLIVGADRAGHTILEAIRAYGNAEYDVIGFIDDGGGSHRTHSAGLPIVGSCQDLPRLAHETGASELIIARADGGSTTQVLFQPLLDCHESGVQITPMVALYEQLTGRIPTEYAGRNLRTVLRCGDYPSNLYRMANWTIDLLLGIAGLAAMVVLLPVVALALKLDGGGPLLYQQVRVGRAGERFQLFKFRTMVETAEPNGPVWTKEQDGRVTRIGRVLRRLHLDEIPQAINILKGDLSFIGPRPERPEFVAELEKQVPLYRARHAVRPGITGWAQVNYQYGSSIPESIVKLEYDLYYIKHQSLWLDLLIMLRTIPLVLAMKGR